MNANTRKKLSNKIYINLSHIKCRQTHVIIILPLFLHANQIVRPTHDTYYYSFPWPAASLRCGTVLGEFVILKPPPPHSPCQPHTHCRTLAAIRTRNVCSPVRNTSPSCAKPRIVVGGCSQASQVKCMRVYGNVVYACRGWVQRHAGVSAGGAF